MINLSITEKAFLAIVRKLDYSTLEHWVLSSKSADRMAWQIWCKYDDELLRGEISLTQSEYQIYNRLGGAMQI